jgi:hypothetical protein
MSTQTKRIERIHFAPDQTIVVELLDGYPMSRGQQRGSSPQPTRMVRLTVHRPQASAGEALGAPLNTVTLPAGDALEDLLEALGRIADAA